MIHCNLSLAAVPGATYRAPKDGQSMANDVDTQSLGPGTGIGFFEKWLSGWVALCIACGIGLGHTAPRLFEILAQWEYASVNLVVALLIWAMVYPMMVNVDFASLRHIGDRPKGLVITLAVNWLIKPFTMAILGVVFFEYIFADLIDPSGAQQYIAGLILLGAAPCTAMVFVWSQLVRGDATYTLVQVSVNDVVMVFAFAPIVALLLGVTDIVVPWETLLLSVGLYVVIPLGAGALTRHFLVERGARAEDGEAAVSDSATPSNRFPSLACWQRWSCYLDFKGGSLLPSPWSSYSSRCHYCCNPTVFLRSLTRRHGRGGFRSMLPHRARSLQSPGQAPIIIATLAPAAGPPEPAGVRCLGNIRPGR